MQEDMVTTLLMYNSLELSIENFHHTTALILASGNGHVKIIDALLADPRCDPNFMVRASAPQKPQCPSSRTRGVPSSRLRPAVHNFVRCRLGPTVVRRCLCFTRNTHSTPL